MPRSVSIGTPNIYAKPQAGVMQETDNCTRRTIQPPVKLKNSLKVQCERSGPIDVADGPHVAKNAYRGNVSVSVEGGHDARAV